MAELNKSSPMTESNNSWQGVDLNTGWILQTNLARTYRHDGGGHFDILLRQNIETKDSDKKVTYNNNMSLTAVMCTCSLVGKSSRRNLRASQQKY